MTAWILWLILCGAFLLLELFTASLAALCGACGCLAAFFFAVFGASADAQLIAAAVGTVASLVFLMPLVNRYRKARGKDAPSLNTNMDALIGRSAPLMRDITAEHPGRVRIDGDNWQARSASGQLVEKGTMVTVTGYDSIILLVKPSEQNGTN